MWLDYLHRSNNKTINIQVVVNCEIYLSLFRMRRAARMSGVKLFNSAQSLKNGCSSNSWADERLSTSTSRQQLRKSLSGSDNLSHDLISGRPLAAIKYKARSGAWFKYGGWPSIISRKSGDDYAVNAFDVRENSPIAIIPKLQISTFFPYCFRVTTSGALQRQ